MLDLLYSVTQLDEALQIGR